MPKLSCPAFPWLSKESHYVSTSQSVIKWHMEWHSVPPIVPSLPNPQPVFKLYLFCCSTFSSTPNDANVINRCEQSRHKSGPNHSIAIVSKSCKFGDVKLRLECPKRSTEWPLGNILSKGFSLGNCPIFILQSTLIENRLPSLQHIPACATVHNLQ